MTINKVFISGNLTRDCEKKGSKDNPVVLFSVAVNERVKDGDEWVDKPNFIDCKAFGKYAAVMAPSLVKGAHVVIEGRLQQDRWEKDGEKRSKVCVKCDNIITPRPKADDNSEEPW